MSHKVLSSLDSNEDRGWEVTAQELSDLVKNRDTGESVPQIQSKYGGLDGLSKKLRSDLKTGLSVEETTEHLVERQRVFGENRLEEKEPTGFFEYFFDALKDETLIILMVSAVISIVLECTLEDASEGWIEGTAILVTVMIVASVTAGNDVVKDKQFRTLSAISADRKIKIERDGKVDQISIFDIVVGDVVVLDTGDYIPADMLLISGQSLSIDESAMTGEAEAVHKNDKDPFLLSGTMVTEGMARGLVIAVGPHSQWGKIKESLEKEDEKTPLQEKLEDLAELIGKIGLTAAIVTFVALLLRWIIKDFAIDHDKWDWDNISDIVGFLIIGITILVVAVPEGLPLAVTLSLAYSMLRMMKDQNLVRHLVACETMGSATCICSDKTGTLTQNKMTVMKLWMGHQVFDDISNSSSSANSAKSMERVTELLCTSVSVNSSAYIEKRESGKIEFVGAKTEGAMLVLAEKLGFQYEAVRESSKVVKLFPFSSAKKRMSTLVEISRGGRLHVKGASEVILDLCNGVLDQKGEVQTLQHDQKKQLNEIINEWASQGLRTLTIAYRDISQDKIDQIAKSDFKEDLDRELILIGIVGIEDPVRQEVPDAIAQCQRAGITVRMVTGDNILTAKKIGRQCGILTDNGVAIEGPDFRKLSAEEIDKLIPKLQIIARCSPHDKLILVKHLRERGEVVGVTGDGTNDAPILREADVGFAMGISGTEVAKSAADVIILDDNFASIEKAVLWGRNVYDSIRKFIQFQSTVNAVALVIAFVGALSKGYSPLTAVQLLWVNLIMDTLAALALATESPNPSLLDRPPHGRNSKLITRLMWRTIIGGAILQLAILFAILYSEPLIDRLTDDDDQDEKDLRKTLIFNVFVLMQVFNEINCRKLENDRNVFKGFFNNPIFLAIIAITLVVQFIMVQFAGPFASTISLTWKQWLFCLGISVSVLPWGFLVRFVPIPQEREEQPSEEKKGLLPKQAQAKHYSGVDHL